MKILKTEVLYQGRLRGIRDHLENDQGKRYTHETIVHPGAVVILPLQADGTVVCVSQYRHSVGSKILELPAGTLEANEPPVECAHREIMEEIGMAAREMIPVGTLYPAPGFCTELQHLFVARDLYAKAAPADEDEDISLVPMTVVQFEQAIVSGSMSDAKSIALFAKARLMGLL
jgi:ADP-ribose pyrophosphatase